MSAMYNSNTFSVGRIASLQRENATDNATSLAQRLFYLFVHLSSYNLHWCIAFVQLHIYITKTHCELQCIQYSNMIVFAILEFVNIYVQLKHEWYSRLRCVTQTHLKCIGRIALSGCDYATTSFQHNEEEILKLLMSIESISWRIYIKKDGVSKSKYGLTSGRRECEPTNTGRVGIQSKKQSLWRSMRSFMKWTRPSLSWNFRRK